MKHLILLVTLLLNSVILLGQYDILYDSTFGSNGAAFVPYKITCSQGVFLQSDGKIVLLSENTINNDSSVFTVVRLNANGTLDVSYNNTGINNTSTIYAKYPYSSLTGLLLANNDLIVSSSNKYMPLSFRSVELHKYRENGTIDSLFGNGGTLTLSEDSIDLSTNGLIRYSDTSLLVYFGGDNNSSDTFFRKNILCKINTNGRIDSSFAVNGRFELPFTHNFTVQKMVLSVDGSIYILGNYYEYPISYYSIVKLNADLTIDPGFQFESTNPFFYVSDLELDEDGKILVVSTAFSSGFRLWRLMPDGSLDNSFSRDGVCDENFNFNANPGQIIVQPDGKLLISIPGGANACRVNPNGTMDYSFDLDGVAQILPNLGSSGIALQPDGKMIFMTTTEAGSIKLIRVKTRP